MSAADAERFIDDMAKDKQLAERLRPHAAGLAALTTGAKTHGYDFTVDELKQAMRAKARHDLNDAQLDAIAGGTGSGPVPNVTVNAPTTVVGPIAAGVTLQQGIVTTLVL